LTWQRIALFGEEEHAIVIGRAGTLPAAIADDIADFYMVVPFNMTLRRLKATMKTGPGINTTFQVRRSINGGGSFTDAFGIVTIAAAAKVGVADPGDLDVSEGDLLNLSVRMGGNSGSNLAIFIIGVAR